MLNEREQAAHDPTIAETAQGLSLAFEKLKADISQSRAARFVLAVLEKLKGAIQMEKTLKTGKIGQFGAESRITYGGVKWVVLDARPNMSLCLAEDVLKDENGEVRYMAFDTDNKNDFAASSVRAFLNGDFLEELAGAGADKEAFVPIVLDLTSDDGLDDYGTDSAKIGLITDQMYRAFRKIIPKASEDYWTCTPFSTERNGYKSFVRSVGTSGALNYNFACSGYWGVRPLCALKSDILVSDNKNSRGNYEFQWNTAPSAPYGISVPESCYSTQNITVTWGASTDPDGDAITYVLERSVNNGSYTKVTETAARTFTEVVSTSWNTIKYRVKARDTYGNESAYVTSSAVPVIHNQPPVISGQNADLGTKSGDFSYKYTVTDPDGDTVTVVEKVDETILRSYTPTLGEENTMNVTGHDFTALSNGAHTITITATDTVGNKAVRTLTFTKQISGFVITLAAPLEAQAQPTRANVKVTREIPAGATFKVEATNDPFDPSPAWEDCTNAVIQGVAHVFENTINTAVKFGMNIRVTVERGDAISACWVSSIGGNFE